MGYIYIYDRESRMPVVEVKDESALFQIKQITTPGAFEEEYFVIIAKEKVEKDGFLGYYPACWQPYIKE